MLIINPHHNECTCIRVQEPHDMCAGEYRLDESGIKAELTPRKGEQVQLIIFDGCACKKKLKKCDALYLLKGIKNKVVVRVELKGTNLVEGVEQLSETVNRDEYKEIVHQFKSISPDFKIKEKAYLISYQQMGSLLRMSLQKEYGFSFQSLVSQKGRGKIHDLRLLL